MPERFTYGDWCVWDGGFIKLDDRGGRGAPDWIIEILSPDTRARDQIRKRALYDCHGLRK